MDFDKVYLTGRLSPVIQTRRRLGCRETVAPRSFAPVEKAVPSPLHFAPPRAGPSSQQPSPRRDPRTTRMEW